MALQLHSHGQVIKSACAASDGGAHLHRRRRHCRARVGVVAAAYTRPGVVLIHVHDANSDAESVSECCKQQSRHT